MQKPYCKMTLKDLLDLINSSKQEPAVPEPEVEKRVEEIPIRRLKDLISVDIDAGAQKTAFALRGRRTFGRNN